MSKPDNMIMKIAKGICIGECALADNKKMIQCEECSKADEWMYFIPTAHSVLKAMKTPTKYMVDKGGSADIWHEMIDAALEEPNNE